MEKIATCIKETGNWSKLDKEHKFDNPSFNPQKVAKDIDVAAPKLKKLIDNIKKLDEEDMKKHGKLFKHFIYSDVKSAYGAKLIASGLASHGFEHAYSLGKGERGVSFKVKKGLSGGNYFATLTSVSFFEKPIGIRFRKELLSLFNSRPDNVYGDKIRLIILDSGFREGIDLFDIKYVHLFEPILTKADQKQAIGRATRFCGQKGLYFEKNKGWPIYVYRYETIVPKDIKNALISQNEKLAPSNTFFDLFLKFTNIDPLKINFANELEPLVIYGAVDRSLTKNVHGFEIEDNTQNKYFNEIFSGGTMTKFQKTQKYIKEKFNGFTWPPTKIENGCDFKAPANPKGPNIIDFSPTQNFVRNYFTTNNNLKGMLLMHSVGTGKTCSAIAVASSSFEKDGYTIVYVTRHTLKADVWKNMFGQTCSVIIQDMIKKGIPIPEAEAARSRLIKAWMPPMSYKQFSNALLGKNSIYHDLVKRNGKEDVLHKTLIIIDEAHKLNAADVSGSEKPDLGAIKKALLKSYEKSGKDSVKLLLMTATPYTDDPMDMIKLMNLMRKPKSQLPETFEEFKKSYLDDTGKFTETGKNTFLDDIAGYISYLNREKDVRSFSYPIMKDIQVPMSQYEFYTAIKKYIVELNDVKHSLQLLNILKKSLQQDIVETRIKLSQEIDFDVEDKNKQYIECLNNLKIRNNDAIKDINKEKADAIGVCTSLRKQCEGNKKKEYKDALKALQDGKKNITSKCKEILTECKDKVTIESKNEILQLKEKSKLDLKNCKRGDSVCKEQIKSKLADDIEKIKEEQKERVEQCKDTVVDCKEKMSEELGQKKELLKEDLKFDIKECSEGAEIKQCVQRANDEHKKKLDELNNQTNKCDEIKTEIKKIKEEKSKTIQAEIDRIVKEKTSEIEFDEGIVLKKRKELSKLKFSIENDIKVDKSQQLQLEECLKTQKVKPQYKSMLKGVLPDYIDEDEEDIREEVPEGAKANIFLVNGHGSEDVKDFDKRVTLPEDKVLVVFPVCGRPNWLNIICLFMDIFNNPKNMKYMSDPVKYQSTIEKMLGYPIRVYLPGEKIPFMTTNLFYNFDLKKTVVLKSGVFKVASVPPINRGRFEGTTDIQLSLGDKSCFKYTGVMDDSSKYNGAVHHEVFKGNIYEKAGKRDTYNNLMYRSFDVKDIINDNGPGIYYYTGCRSAKGKIKDNDYAKILEKSTKQQKKSHRGSVIRKFKEQHLRVQDLQNLQNKSASPIVTPKSNSKSKNPKNPKDPKDLKELSRKQRRILQIKREVSKLFDDLFNLDKNEVEAKCELFKDELSKIESEGRIFGVQNIKLSINDLLIILQGNVKHQESLQFSKTKKHYTIETDKVYTIDKRKYKITDKVLGVLPTGLKDTNIKCSTDTLIRRIKQIYKKGKLDKLDIPKDLDEWTAPSVFENMCIATKNLVSKSK